MRKTSCFLLLFLALFCSAHGRADEVDGDFKCEEILLLA